MTNGVEGDLDWVLSGEEVDQVHSLFHNSDCQLLFTVVTSSGGHQHVGETLNDWALHLLESSLLVAASSVRNINLLLGGLHLEVVSQ